MNILASIIMTTINKEMSNDKTNVSLGNVTHQCDLGEAFATVYDNRIYHIKTNKNTQITMETVHRGQAFVDSIGGGKFFNLYEFDAFSDVSPEVREFAASKTGNHHTIGDAIVISSFSQKILADFYLRFNKPAMPTKVFNDVVKASEWLLSLK
jgi:hypothetical protein